MRRLCYLIMFFLLTPMLLLAQQNQGADQERREKTWKEIESWKVAYFTHELNITPEEAVNFWPLYNEMNQKLMGLDRQKRELRRSIYEKGAQCKETDCVDLLHKMMDLDKSRLAIKHEAYEKIAKILPVSKLLKLDDIEERFRQKLFDYLRKRSNNNPPPRGPEK